MILNSTEYVSEQDYKGSARELKGYHTKFKSILLGFLFLFVIYIGYYTFQSFLILAIFSIEHLLPYTLIVTLHSHPLSIVLPVLTHILFFLSLSLSLSSCPHSSSPLTCILSFSCKVLIKILYLPIHPHYLSYICHFPKNSFLTIHPSQSPVLILLFLSLSDSLFPFTLILSHRPHCPYAHAPSSNLMQSLSHVHFPFTPSSWPSSSFIHRFSPNLPSSPHELCPHPQLSPLGLYYLHPPSSP